MLSMCSANICRQEAHPKAPLKNKTNDTAHCNPRRESYTNSKLGRKGKGDNSAAVIAVDSATIVAV